VFPVTKLGKIAGCYVLDGRIVRSAKVKVRRGKDTLFEGGISSLKRFKDDVREVTAGYECGLAIAGFDDLSEGDVIECFETKHVAAKLDESLKDEAKRKKSDPEVSASM
jgi:translation initiation factor IF-2